VSAFFVALRKELLEQRRTSRLLVAIVVLVAFGLISPLTAKFMPEIFKLLPQGEQIARIIPPPTAQDAVAQYIKNTDQFAILLALLMAMGAVALEKDKGTAALTLVKPMPRSAFILAKFVALGLTFVVSIALAGVAAYYYTLILFGPLPLLPWLALNGLLLLHVLVFVALTLLGSTLFKSQALAGGLAFAGLIVLSLLGSLPGVGQYSPDRLLLWGAGLMGAGGSAQWVALGTSAALIAVSLLVACLAFRMQEL
jgi:ABC-2 type transport system permease protein